MYMRVRTRRAVYIGTDIVYTAVGQLMHETALSAFLDPMFASRLQRSRSWKKCLHTRMHACTNHGVNMNKVIGQICTSQSTAYHRDEGITSKDVREDYKVRSRWHASMHIHLMIGAEVQAFLRVNYCLCLDERV